MKDKIRILELDNVHEYKANILTKSKTFNFKKKQKKNTEILIKR